MFGEMSRRGVAIAPASVKIATQATELADCALMRS
jgi:hypothetical protein